MKIVRSLTPHLSGGRSIAVVLLALLGAMQIGCSSAASTLGATPADARENVDGLFGALAARFGPLRRSDVLREARQKVIAGSLTPSRIYDAPGVWTSAESSTRTLEYVGGWSGGGYVLAPTGDAPFPRTPGESRHRLSLRPLDDGAWEWSLRDQIGIGQVRARPLFGAFAEALAALEPHNETTIRRAVSWIFPRTSAALGDLFSIRSLTTERHRDGSTSLALDVRMQPERMRRSSPNFARYLERYIVPARYELAINDPHGTPWLLASAQEQQIAVRFRTRGGGLVPLEGDLRPAPDSFHITLAFSGRVMLFTVGATEMHGTLHILDTPDERGWVMRFQDEPTWQLPLAVENLVRAPLRRPFADEGIQLRLSVRDSAGAQTVLTRELRVAVQESAIVRFLNRLGNKAMSDVTEAVELEMLGYSARVFGALQRDVGEMLPSATRLTRGN